MEANGHQAWLRRHRDLAGRDVEPWIRRAGLGVLTLLMIAALLNAFGQRTERSRASNAIASLKLKAPPRARGGDIFEARFDVRAFREIRQPTLVLDPGWLEGLTQNTAKPQAKSERSDNGRIVLEYDTLPAGRKLSVWLQYQVNPTYVGAEDQDVELWDGTTKLIHLNHSFRSFP
jgi:hypothetical protein